MGGGEMPATLSQMFTDQLTLFKPGGYIIPTTLLLTPGYSDLPTALGSMAGLAG